MHLIVLLPICLAMAVGAFAAGYIPLLVKGSSSKLKYITAFGSGLLIGCALIVIIPEGISTINSASKLSKQLPMTTVTTEKTTTTNNQRRAIDLIPQPAYILQKRGINDSETHNSSFESHTTKSDVHITKDNDSTRIESTTSETKSTSLPSESDEKASARGAEEDNISHHKAVGIALILGFCFMFLVDYFGGSSHGHTHDAIPLSMGIDSELSSPLPLKLSTPSAFSPALGLLIHSAADGIAMGAASAGNQEAVGIAVFLAIILHKAPAAFGLSAYLLQLGHSTMEILKPLAAFSLAAPVMALLTHLALSMFETGDSYMLQWATGWLLLFSGGTFLFVATIHSFPSHGIMELDKYEVISLIVGMMAPLLLPIDD